MYNGFFVNKNVLLKLQNFIQDGDDLNLHALMEFYFHPFPFLFQKNNFNIDFWQVIIFCCFRWIEDFVFNRKHEVQNLNFYALFKDENYKVYINACEKNHKNIIQFFHQYVLSNLNEQELYRIYKYLILHEKWFVLNDLRLFLSKKNIETIDWDLELVSSTSTFHYLYSKINPQHQKIFVIKSFVKAISQVDLYWSLDLLDNPRFERYLSQLESEYYISSIEHTNYARYRSLHLILKYQVVFNYLQKYGEGLLIWLVQDMIRHYKDGEDNLIAEDMDEIDFIRQLMLPFMNQCSQFVLEDIHYLRTLIGKEHVETTDYSAQQIMGENHFFQNHLEVDIKEVSDDFDNYPLSWAERFVSLFS